MLPSPMDACWSEILVTYDADFAFFCRLQFSLDQHRSFLALLSTHFYDESMSLNADSVTRFCVFA